MAKKKTGIMLPAQLSPKMSDFIGKSKEARTEVMKKLWIYIKKHDLQDAKNRRMINFDDTLRDLFGKRSAKMTELAGLIGPHIISAKKS